MVRVLLLLLLLVLLGVFTTWAALAIVADQRRGNLRNGTVLLFNLSVTAYLILTGWAILVGRIMPVNTVYRGNAPVFGLERVLGGDVLYRHTYIYTAGFSDAQWQDIQTRAWMLDDTRAVLDLVALRKGPAVPAWMNELFAVFGGGADLLVVWRIDAEGIYRGQR